MEGITSLPKAELVALGTPLRTPYLLQQASRTVDQARTEGEPLAKRLPPGFVDKVAAARAEVAQSYEDKTISAADAKLATGSQNEAMREVKVWSRGAAARCQATIRMGALIPDEMANPVSARSVPAAIAQAQRHLGLLGEFASVMDAVGAPTQPLIEEGRKLLDALIAADSAQELTRSSALPAAVANFYAKKGELYIGLKIINDAGHELYAHDPPASSRFNLSLLYRRHAPAATPPAADAPVPPAT